MNIEEDRSSQPPGAEGEVQQHKAESHNHWEIEHSPMGLVDSPIDFLFAEHYRQRQAANILYLIAGGEFNKAGVKNLIDFLNTDFALHVADEELSFFPVLKQRCLPEDKIVDLIERLTQEHKKDEAIVTSVTETLTQLLAGKKVKDNQLRGLYHFAEHIIKHLALENAVLLPIARARLNDEALGILSTMMKERRSSDGV